MTVERFNEIVADEMSTVEKTLVRKQAEYNLVEDRFDNFKTAATLRQCTPEEALTGYVAKQIVSLYSMVKSQDTFSMDLWQEKLNDIICYMILLLGLLEDTGRGTTEE